MELHVSIEFQNVSFTYPRAHRAALSDISYLLTDGRMTAVLGENGAGKSTLLKLLIGIIRPASGRVRIDGDDTTGTSTAELAARVAVTFQNPADQIFSSRVRTEVEFGPQNLGRPQSDLLAERAMESVGLASAAERHPYDLNAAQRRLLTVASAVAMDTMTLAFDEPTSGLSQRERPELAGVFRTLLSAGKSILIATHDLDFFLPFADRFLVLHAGRLVFDGARPELLGRAGALRAFGVRLPLTVRLERFLQEEDLREDYLRGIAS